jgi:hypothetical protein
MSVSADAMVSIPEDVLFRELDGEAIILNLAKGLYYGLDAVGTRIWIVLAESSSVGRAIDVMTAEYEVDPAVAAQDVVELVSVLRDQGLLVVNAPPNAS